MVEDVIDAKHVTPPRSPIQQRNHTPPRNPIIVLIVLVENVVPNILP
jgi:hypothetical protein